LDGFFVAPRSRFRRLRFNASKSVSSAHLIEAGISKRPFARPHRLPLSGSPGWGQRSRPASSTTSLAHPRTRSALLSPPRAGFPCSRRVNDQNPLSEGLTSYPDLSTGVRSPPGLSPLGIEALHRFPGLEAYRDATPDLPSLPTGIACYTLPADHRSRSATLRPAHLASSSTGKIRRPARSG
jgi:hypothetical protein